MLVLVLVCLLEVLTLNNVSSWIIPTFQLGHTLLKPLNGLKTFADSDADLLGLDIKSLNRTIAEWIKPLPVEYLSQPLVIAGPSGVGKARLTKVGPNPHSYCILTSNNTC